MRIVSRRRHLETLLKQQEARRACLRMGAEQDSNSDEDSIGLGVIIHGRGDNSGVAVGEGAKLEIKKTHSGVQEGNGEAVDERFKIGVGDS